MEKVVKKIRVLVVIPDGGNKVSMIFAHRQMNNLDTSLIELDFFMLRSRTSIKILFSDLIAFRQKLAVFEPDIVHAHYGTVTSFFCAFAGNKPLIITFRGSDLNPVPSEKKIRVVIKQIMSQLSALRAKHIICVSQELKKRLWWKKSKVSIMPSGVDLSIFKPLPIEIARKQLGLSINDKIILFNAGKSPLTKRLDLAEQAVDYAKTRLDNIYFITLYGNIDPDDMPLYYNAADCLLLTSDYEGSPNVIKEALSCSCPIVSVNVGDVRERLAGVWPSKVTKRDPAEIGEGVIEILKIGKRSNGLDFVQDLSLKNQAVQLLSIYKSTIQSK